MNSRIKELDTLELILTKKIDENNDKITSLQTKIDELKKENKKYICNITPIINEKLLLSNNNNPVGFFVWNKCKCDKNDEYYCYDYEDFNVYTFHFGNKIITNEETYKYIPIYDLDNIYIIFGKNKHDNYPNYDNLLCVNNIKLRMGYPYFMRKIKIKKNIVLVEGNNYDFYFSHNLQDEENYSCHENVKFIY